MNIQGQRAGSPRILAVPTAGVVTPGRLPRIAVIVVGYRNPGDVVGCLRALARLDDGPTFGVFIAENGGGQGMDMLLFALNAARSPVLALPGELLPIMPARRGRCGVFSLRRNGMTSAARVYVAEMTENLGYAGGINAWLRPLITASGWEGVWVVNPDTEPLPSALDELMKHAARRRKGMVGSRITFMDAPDITRLRGLAWRKLRANTVGVGRHLPADVELDDAEIDAPSGASIYVSRDLIDRIGLMDERYFLYFEDLEWGDRAKAIGELGYAHHSIVRHKGGTTTGGAGSRAQVSRLSVYLEVRNRIIYVRESHSGWLAWTALMQMTHALAYLAAGSPRNMFAAYRGLLAGLRGEVGRPDRLVETHQSGSRTRFRCPQATAPPESVEPP